MKGEPIVRPSRAGQRMDKTDWARVRAMTEDEVERGAAHDPENPAWTPDELAAARLIRPAAERKIPVSIRLDREVLDYFKGQGPGYQSRIGAVLLAFVRSQEHDTAG
jgi:uncharacterized protein (DUF4415 family)